MAAGRAGDGRDLMAKRATNSVQVAKQVAMVKALAMPCAKM
jgi:hypothetical protein